MPVPLRIALLAVLGAVAGPASAQGHAAVACGPGAPADAPAVRRSAGALAGHLDAVAAAPVRVAAPAPCLEASPARAALATSTERHQDWDAAAATWADAFRDLLATDALGRLVDRVRQQPTEAAWVNDRQTLYAYPAGDDLVIETRTWDGAAWVPVDRSTFTYRADGRSTGTVAERWDGGWLVVSRTTTAYDGAGRQTEVLQEARASLADPLEPTHRTLTAYAADGLGWSTVAQEWRAGWRDVSRTTLATDASGRPVERVLEERRQGGWAPDSRSLYSYGPDADEVISQTWDAGAGGWDNAYQTVTVVSADAREIVATNAVWSDSLWTPLDQTHTRLDAAARTVGYETRQWDGRGWGPVTRLARAYAGDVLVEESAERWSAADAGWRLSTTLEVALAADGQPLLRASRRFQSDGVTLQSGADVEYAYDERARVVSQTTTDYDAGAWAFDRRVLTTYDDAVAATTGRPRGALRVAIRPTPAVAGATVRVEGAAGPLRVDVFDVLGRRVATLHDGSPGTVGGLALPALVPGAYVVRAVAGERVAAVPLTVAR